MGDPADGLQCKVVLIGTSGTGKTSIIYRLIHNAFESELRTTLGAGLSTYWTSFWGRPVKLNIWDTAGQENYRSLARIYFRDAQCVLIVYDLADRSTFDDITYWLGEVEQLAPDTHFDTIVASKSDLRGDRAVSEDEGRALAKSIRAAYYEVSAATGEGIIELFEGIAERYVKFRDGRVLAESEKPLEHHGGRCC
jgi:small GTP-binding protein